MNSEKYCDSIFAKSIKKHTLSSIKSKQTDALKNNESKESEVFRDKYVENMMF